MVRQMDKRKLTLLIVIVIIGAAVGVGIYYILSQNVEGLKIFAAGSLAVPLEELNEKFEEKYGVKVYLETAGSIQTVKKISELHMPGDIVAVADYNAIKDYLMPNYTSWFIKFAKNELVITYTSQSGYANEINESNWYEILSKGNVSVGFSSPNDDPCGYRAVMMFYLADLFYHKRIFENIVENNTGIKLKSDMITVPSDPELITTQGKVYIKQKSVDLLGDLETGNIDYAIEYMSVAKQHNLRYLRLPDDINLSNSSKSDFYNQAVVKLADGKIIHGDAINYAITIPNTSEHKDLAIKYIQMLIGGEGNKILEECGQPPMYEAYGSVPEELKK